MNNNAENWFNNLPANQNKPLTQLRKLILACGKDIEEDIKWSRPCYSKNHLFCYLQKSKAHVTIGFHRGTQLDDPDSLLEGQGKDMRHIKIGFDDKINSTAIKKLIENAIALDQNQIGFTPRRMR